MGKFILSARQGVYEFWFSTSAGEKLVRSTPHITKSSAQQAINDTRRFAGSLHLYVKKETSGQYYFELFDETGKLLLASEKFWSPESRDYAIAILKKEAAHADFAEAI